jgi:2'-5' RNA ligase
LTLKFIGEKSPADVEEIKAALGRLQANAMKINIRGYGFFPNLKSPRVLWAGVEAGPPLALLAAAVDESMAALGMPKEDHGFSPHLTLARSGGSGSRRRDREKPQNRVLQALPEKLAALPAPEFGTMTARQFFLYQSQPSPGGSRYTKLEGFELR